MEQIQEKFSLLGLIEKIPERTRGIECIGLSGSSAAYLLSRVYLELRGPIFVIVPSPKKALKLLGELQYFLKGCSSAALYFPPYNLLPFKFLSYHNETAAKRIATLYQSVTSGTPPIVVTTAGALLQKIIPRKELNSYAELIMVGEEIEREFLVEKLISGGYVISTIVEEPGDFSVRGGIFDIFSPLHSDPVRIEFFGDTVESLRTFSATSQRKIKHLKEAVILPAREVILKKECLTEIIGRVRKQTSMLGVSVTRVRELVARIKNEGVFPGAESLLPLIYAELGTIFDYVPDGALIVQIEPEELQNSALELERQAQNNFIAASEEGRLCVEPALQYLKWEEVKKVLAVKKPLEVKMLPVLRAESNVKQTPFQYNFYIEDNASISAALKTEPQKENLFLPLADWIREKNHTGFTVIIVCRQSSQVERLKLLLQPYGVRLRLAEEFPHFQKGEGIVYASLGDIEAGFVWADQLLALVAVNEIFGTRPRGKSKARGKIRQALLTFEDLKRGDLIVHDEHGIGRYDGLVKLKLNRSTNDFLLILYKDGDKLYLPVDRMKMVQKYMGLEGITPDLDKMGGKSWARVKARVKKSAQKIAGELLKLYAARKVAPGHAFSVSDEYLGDFEAGFSYAETADQLKAIDDVLHDLEKPIPMDRLICGDVGYGKTEVAIRASFAAVNNGKQVAMLVPTTVLAEQHFMTFSDRFKDYPVQIGCLSRFRSMTEQRAIIRDLKAGKMDIVIGTHRLLSKDVGFKDIGLLVLDEEQRFGVKHKEKLKKIRHTVDVLTLTATPIPRTLHMSLLGIRDISVISTPPEYRQAIITYISEFDDAVVVEAIRKELKRKGQVFFIHNNINSIQQFAQKLRILVPEARQGIAHGRLNENELERVMIQFINKEIDLLVCTTIVESGLDIPSANTMLVNRADKFGLAQMYQLRGRVGRSDEQAYAYLFIPQESILGKDAQKRLKVLMEHSDLGSGFQIAMNDLKIRGGGTILGASQSGRIAAVGYDMFLKLMETAIADLKGEPIQESLEPEININISAFIPEPYIPDIDQRLSAYRRLSKMTNSKEVTVFKEELLDRFGPLPNEAVNLLFKIVLKISCLDAGVSRLDLKEHQLLLTFSEAHQKRAFGIVDMIASNPDQFKFTPEHILKVQLTQHDTGGLLLQIKNILKEITRHVNN
jgi:transcription-repair coupling factor (superfamily II helicase)